MYRKDQYEYDRYGNLADTRPEHERLADEHWNFVGPLLEYTYKMAFHHGAKHQKEICEKTVKE